MDSELQNHLDRIKDDVRRVSIYRDMLSKQVSDIDAQEQKLRYHVELRQKEGEILKSWLEDSVHKNIDSMSELATTALQHVIDDQEISFRIQPEPKNNRLQMKFVVEQDGNEGDPLDSFGGGASVIISLVLRLAVMARMNMGNLLLLDESLSALANAYVPNCGAFMRQLSEKTGINILMVTHNQEFLNHAHVSYEGYKDGSLKLKRLKVNQ
jgi:DNA repair exonuclease SbcCD ATPase subunit